MALVISISKEPAAIILFFQQLRLLAAVAAVQTPIQTVWMAVQAAAVLESDQAQLSAVRAIHLPSVLRKATMVVTE
jgi:hypothetical protein